MLIGTNGIVVDNKGRILLILRDDTRTWAIPGGALEAGELPTEGVSREVEEETGLSVQPARLVGLYHWNDRAEDLLIFAFRCVIEGGEIATSEESLRVAFSDTKALPRSMLNLHRERLQRALIHRGGPPYWGEQKLTVPMILWRRLVGPAIYGAKDLRRKIRGAAAYHPPIPWDVGAFVIIQNEAGEILWLKRTDYEVWNLPGGGQEIGEAPWTTAVRETKEEAGVDIEITGCAGVYVKPKNNQMILSFTARIIAGELTTSDEARAFSYFAPGSEPINALPKQVQRAADAISPQGDTVFRIQDEPSGLELLGIKHPGG